MNITECKKLIASMMAVYENYSPKDPELTAMIWADTMPDYSYTQADAALRSYIRSNTSGFAPAPGQLIDIIKTMTDPKELNEMEAWAIVSKALRNGYYGAEQEFKKLPPIVQKAVGSPSQLRNWSQTDADSVENVIQSNFMRTYRQELANSRKMRKIPQGIRSTLEQSKGAFIEGEKYEQQSKGL